MIGASGGVDWHLPNRKVMFLHSAFFSGWYYNFFLSWAPQTNKSWFDCPENILSESWVHYIQWEHVCLLFFFFAIHVSRFFSSYFFCYPHFFSIRIFLSAFSHPHPPSAGIRSAFYRHPRDTTKLAIRRDFLGYSKLMFLIFVLFYFLLPGNFYYGSEICHGIFWGINFGPAIFWGFVWSPRNFLGFWFLPHLIIAVTWNPESSLWAWVKLKMTLNFSHFPSQVNLYSLIGNCVGESIKKPNLLKAVKYI